jgi:hypothetical protein
MTEKRRTARCETCGEPREMATTSECFACYRARRRAEQEPIDRHNAAIRKEHRLLLTGWSKLMVALSELRVNRRDVLEIRDIVAPYVAPVREFLTLPEREHAQVAVHSSVEPTDDLPVSEREHGRVHVQADASVTKEPPMQ